MFSNISILCSDQNYFLVFYDLTIANVLSKLHSRCFITVFIQCSNIFRLFAVNSTKLVPREIVCYQMTSQSCFQVMFCDRYEIVTISPGYNKCFIENSYL